MPFLDALNLGFQQAQRGLAQNAGNLTPQARQNIARQPQQVDPNLAAALNALATHPSQRINIGQPTHGLGFLEAFGPNRESVQQRQEDLNSSIAQRFSQPQAQQAVQAPVEVPLANPIPAPVFADTAPAPAPVFNEQALADMPDLNNNPDPAIRKLVQQGSLDALGLNPSKRPSVEFDPSGFDINEFQQSTRLPKDGTVSDQAQREPVTSQTDTPTLQDFIAALTGNRQSETLLPDVVKQLYPKTNTEDLLKQLEIQRLQQSGFLRPGANLLELLSR